MNVASQRVVSILAAVLAIAGCMMFAGCSSSGATSASSSESGSSSSSEVASSSSSSSSTDSSASEKESLVLGTAGADGLRLTFTNATGLAITDLVVIPSAIAGEAEVETTSLMKAGEEIAQGEQAVVLVDPVEGSSLFDVSIECGDDVYTLHSVDFNLLDAATIRLEGDVAYLEIVVDGSVISTLTEEYDLAHPEVIEEVTEEEAVDAYVDEEVVPEAFSEEAPVVEEEPVVEVAEEPVYYEEPVAQEAPAQSEDSCVSDIVLR